MVKAHLQKERSRKPQILIDDGIVYTSQRTNWSPPDGGGFIGSEGNFYVANIVQGDNAFSLAVDQDTMLQITTEWLTMFRRMHEKKDKR